MPSSSAPSDAGAAVLARVRTDKDLQVELQRIAGILGDKENWDRRVEGLKELRAIVEADVSRFESCVPALSQLIKHPLETQLADLRSAIVREACACVRAMAHSAGSGVAEAVSEWYVKVLYSASCATVAVIAQNADDTLRVIAGSGRLNRPALIAFFTGCQSKHSTMRKNAYHYLLMVLLSVEHAVLQRHSTTIEKLLRTGVADAVQEARRFARLGVWAFERVCKKSARQLIDSLESAVKRAVERDRDELDVWIESGEQRASAGPTSPSAPAPRGRPATTTATAAEGARRPAAERRSRGASADPPRAAPEREAHATPVRRAPSREPTTGTPQSAAQSPPGYAATAAQRAAAQRAAATRARSRSNSARPSESDTPSAPPSTRAPAQQRRPAAATSARRGASAHGPRGGAKEPEGAPSDDAWYGALDGANSSDWLTRMRSFDGITEFVATGTLSMIRASDCLPLVISHLSDTHYRVVLAVMQTCDTMVEKVPDVLAPALERVLVPLFQRLTDPKKQVAEKARSSLDALRRVYGVDTLVPVLHKVLDVSNNKVRVAAIEFTTYLLGFAAKYFAVAPALRATLHRMLAILSRRPPADVHRTALTFLARLYDRHRETFVMQVNALNQAEQQEALELLRKTIPHLAQDCKRQLSGEQLLRHAPVADDEPDHSSPGGGSNDGSPGGKSRLPTYGDHRDGAERALGPRSGKPQRGGGEQRHADPMAYDPTAPAAADRFAGSPGRRQGRDDDANAHESTVVIPTSPVAQWRAERGMPREIQALKTAETSEQRRAALQQANGALTANAGLWRDHFLRLIAFPLSFTADGGDHSLRFAALESLRAVLTVDYLRDQAASQHEAILRAAVACLEDPFPEVQAEAVSCFREASATFDAADVLRSQLHIAEALLPMNARCLEFVLRELAAPFRRAVDTGARVPSSVLAQLAPLVEVLTTAFGHHSSDIRKTAVLDFVDMYLGLGDDVLPRLAHLSHSQLKLISIYVVRAAGGREPVDLCNRMIDLGIIAPRF